VNHEQLDEVVPEEVPRCRHDEADDFFAALRDQTPTARHRLVDEGASLEIAATCQRVELLQCVVVAVASGSYLDVHLDTLAEAARLSCVGVSDRAIRRASASLSIERAGPFLSCRRRPGRSCSPAAR
jgi:hypothetical protein